MAKAKKKHATKYTDEAIRALAALSDEFSLTHQLLTGLSKPGRPVVSPPPVATADACGSACDWIVAEAKRMKFLGEIREGVTKTNFAKKLATRMKGAWASGDAPRPVGYRHIQNNLQAWRLWPISSIE